MGENYSVLWCRNYHALQQRSIKHTNHCICYWLDSLLACQVLINPSRPTLQVSGQNQQLPRLCRGSECSWCLILLQLAHHHQSRAGVPWLFSLARNSIAPLAKNTLYYPWSSSTSEPNTTVMTCINQTSFDWICRNTLSYNCHKRVWSEQPNGSRVDCHF